jgi:hypothetical protein
MGHAITARAIIVPATTAGGSYNQRLKRPASLLAFLIVTDGISDL